jgi:hypothetical protein
MNVDVVTGYSIKTFVTICYSTKACFVTAKRLYIVKTIGYYECGSDQAGD